MEKKVLADTAFQAAMATAHILVERVDFPQRKRLSAEMVARNDSLAQHYQFEGVYPTLVIVPAGGGRYAKTAYHNESATVYASLILARLDALHE